MKSGVREFLDAIPNSHVYLWLPEVDGHNFAQGRWSIVFRLPKYKGIDNLNLPLAEVYRIVWEELEKIYRNIKEKIGYP
ncbi:MAG TPA: hypothetical protein EYP82_07720, partial [Hydrogenothermaceae bacterium]|nr:hypothetical protein [Hydrogenothermaceae bacterium]